MQFFKREKMKKYLATRPETICSILQAGKLPETLPSYLKGQLLFFFDSPQEAALNSSTNSHQTFIVQLELRSSVSAINSSSQQKKRALDSDTNAISSSECSRFQPAAVEQVICYSERGEKILKNLLKQQRMPAIIVDATLFTLSCTTITNSSSSGYIPYSPDTKRSKTVLASSPSSLFSANSPRNSPYSEIKNERLIQRLSTPAEHIALLKQALAKAKKSLLITSYDIRHQALVHINFYTELEQTLSKGVKVYIYFNDSKGADEEALRTLSRFPNVKCEEAFTHSKFLCVDRQWVSIGSFNWLSSIREKSVNAQTEGSLVSHHGQLNKDLLQDIWSHLRFYRNIQFENYKAVCAFERREESQTTATYDLDSHSALEYIPSLDQHCGFLQEMLEQAKRKVVICSPFLSMRQFLADIDKTLLRTFTHRGVSLFIITSSQNFDYPQLDRYLKSINSDFIHLIDHRNFHLKTLIIDDEIISEGSFNWLSAVRDEESEFHNHEATLLVRGPAAGELIQQFYDSPIGQKMSGRQAQDCLNSLEAKQTQTTSQSSSSLRL